MLQSQTDVGQQGFTIRGQDMHHSYTHTHNKAEKGPQKKNVHDIQNIKCIPIEKGKESRGGGGKKKVKEMKNSEKGVG